MHQHSLIFTVFALAAVLALSHAIALEVGWYLEHVWFDVLVHLLGGVVVALFTLYLYRGVWPEERVDSAAFVLTLLIAATFVAGVGWEILEQQLHLTWDAGYSLATAKDLAVDVAGGLLVGAFLWSRAPMTK